MTDGKLYYSISEVSDAADVKPHVLRYWETQFKMLRPKKNCAGNRQYRARDLNLVLTIRDLLYRHGYTIAGARRKLLDARRIGVLVDGQLVDAEAAAAVNTAAGAPVKGAAVPTASGPTKVARSAKSASAGVAAGKSRSGVSKGRSEAAGAEGAAADVDGSGVTTEDAEDPGQLTFADATRVAAVSEVRRELESLLAMLESTPGAR